MIDEALRSLWQKGGGDSSLSPGDIERLVQDGIRRGSKKWRSYVLINVT
jgi:hypothetical protein